MQFHYLLGNQNSALFYQKQAASRLAAITEIFWDEERLQWFDLDIWTGESKKDFYATNWMPLWANAFDPATQDLDAILQNMIKYEQGFQFPAGMLSLQSKLTSVRSSNLDVQFNSAMGFSECVGSIDVLPH
jgi:neutral trehalase